MEITLPYKAYNLPLFSDCQKLKWFIELLFFAQSDYNTGCNSGEIIISLSELSKRLNASSKGALNYFLKQAEAHGLIQVLEQKGKSKIIIQNYFQYIAVIPVPEKTKQNKQEKQPITAQLIKPEKEPNFIDQLLDIFKDEYYNANGKEYIVTSKAREISSIARTLNKYKEKFPEADTAEAKEGMRIFFRQCCNINDNWLRNNMSPSIMYSKLNQITNILKQNGTVTGNSKGFDATELANFACEISREFGNDYIPTV